jgi:osmotically-inducible protein OsmY
VGTVSVVDNRLEVDWWKNRGVRGGRPVLSDDQIERAVQDSLEQDLRIMRPSDIEIAVEDWKVTLKGSAPDYYQKTIARQDAGDIVGVRSVVDLIDIDRSNRDDETIASELALDLQTDYALADHQIGVFVDQGTATLRGEVRSPFEREHAEVVAASVPGVRAVVNDILVQPAVGYSDEALKERIEARLAANWRTRSVAPRIHVVVEDGSATLTGEIDSWPERMEAGRIARLVEGVSDVTNDLSLVGSESPAISLLERRGDDAND